MGNEMGPQRAPELKPQKKWGRTLIFPTRMAFAIVEMRYPRESFYFVCPAKLQACSVPKLHFTSCGFWSIFLGFVGTNL